MNTYLDGEGGVFMEKSYTKIYTTGATVPLKIRPGHFATNHAHINYYIDVTTLKARTKEAEGEKHGSCLHLQIFPSRFLLCGRPL